MDRILAFVDLLGFSRMVKKNHHTARQILNDFYNICFDVIKRNRRVKGSLFSDSLLAHSNDYPALVNSIAEIYRGCLQKNDSYNSLSEFFLLPRGAISIGYVNIEQRDTAPNLSKDFIVSPALVHSAEMEKSIKGSRLLLAVKNDGAETREIQWNDNIKSIMYENTTLELWNNYTYQDALWFRDLTKSDLEQKREVRRLIAIAIKLAKKHSHNNAALEQHINTLRIGLLSYTKFLELENDAVLQQVIREFKADKYWMVWVTIIEIIMNSQEQYKYAAMKSVVEFYKKSSLKTGWIRVLEEINKPGNDYLKQSFELFLDELHIAVID